MTIEEQQKLFAAVRKRWKKWSGHRASGYVHGVINGLSYNKPLQFYVQRFKDDPYAYGYIYGFIDAYGEDALTAEWSQGLNIAKEAVSYHWWEK